ncbi:MAG: hypothetical protein KIS63_00255 [Caldilineales bacterium]|jgi:hypothetical protein|nr:hypothetical protein [Planctomycetales bacterium]MCW5856688.1 hypothetical protein [Caldilineales bacterium]
MQRKEWKFDYPAPQLGDAAHAKVSFHAEQIDFWMKKREDLMATIREEGIEINEKIALGYVNPKARDWDRGGEIMIRNDLRKGLMETFEKLSYHTGKRDTYDGWEQVLRANPNATLALDIDDWLFFFGRDTDIDDERL